MGQSSTKLEKDKYVSFNLHLEYYYDSSNKIVKNDFKKKFFKSKDFIDSFNNNYFGYDRFSYKKNKNKINIILYPYKIKISKKDIKSIINKGNETIISIKTKIITIKKPKKDKNIHYSYLKNMTDLHLKKKFFDFEHYIKSAGLFPNKKKYHNIGDFSYKKYSNFNIS